MFSGTFLVAQIVKNLPAMWETWVRSLGWEDSLGKGMVASLVAQTVKAPVCNAGDPGSVPGSGRFPGEGNGNPLQYSYLENSMDRRVWRAAVPGVTKSRT